MMCRGAVQRRQPQRTSQAAGTCMMRTRDLTDPASWRAWNGSAFSVSLSQSPYEYPDLDPSLHVCVPFSSIT